MTPNGSQTLSKAPGNLGSTRVPFYANHGYGPTILDVDGNVYIDYICSLAAVTLGHSHRTVTNAVRRAAMAGPLLSLPSYREVEVAERLTRLTGYEMARFVKTGSESVQAAVRLARAETKRRDIIVMSDSYHGWHDWFQGAKNCPGVIRSSAIHIARYGDIDHIKEVVRYCCQGQPAAIVVEPHRFEHTSSVFTQMLRALCTQLGTALIFDEMVYGFRWAIAGAKEAWGIEPDIACYGKAMANGVPIAAVVGSERFMQHAGECLISGTHGGDLIGLEAADVVMQIYDEQAICQQLDIIGSRFHNGFNRIAGNLAPGVVACEGFSVHPRITFRNPALMEPFLAGMAARGVLMHQAMVNFTIAHTDAIIDETLAKCEAVLETLIDKDGVTP